MAIDLRGHFSLNAMFSTLNILDFKVTKYGLTFKVTFK